MNTSGVKNVFLQLLPFARRLITDVQKTSFPRKSAVVIMLIFVNFRYQIFVVYGRRTSFPCEAGSVGSYIL